MCNIIRLQFFELQFRAVLKNMFTSRYFCFSSVDGFSCLKCLCKAFSDCFPKVKQINHVDLLN